MSYYMVESVIHVSSPINRKSALTLHNIAATAVDDVPLLTLTLTLTGTCTYARFECIKYAGYCDHESLLLIAIVVSTI